jgi:Zn-dependent peptidase ImmA (M78 family)
MDEADVRQKARAFVAKVDVSDIRANLTPYVVAANAKVKKDELGEGESGYTITKPNGKHVITVNSLETEERQRFTICHEIAHIALDLESSLTKKCRLGPMLSAILFRYITFEEKRGRVD